MFKLGDKVFIDQDFSKRFTKGKLYTIKEIHKGLPSIQLDETTDVLVHPSYCTLEHPLQRLIETCNEGLEALHKLISLSQNDNSLHFVFSQGAEYKLRAAFPHYGKNPAKVFIKEDDKE